MAHTRGPWVVDRETGRVLAGGRPVAVVLKWHNPLAQLSNLQLIASAPLLLEAHHYLDLDARPENWNEIAEDFAEETTRQRDAWLKLDAAIARAEGRS